MERDPTQNEAHFERPWLFGILIGFPLFMIGGALMFTLIGTPLGLILFAVGLGLMLSPKPIRGEP